MTRTFRLCCLLLFLVSPARAQSTADFPPSPEAPAAPAPSPARVLVPETAPAATPPDTEAQAAPESSSEPPPSPAKDVPAPSVSLTMASLHLILPVFEGTIEAKMADHFGVAAMGGFGSMSDRDGSDAYELFYVQEAAVQFGFYPFDRFEGLVLRAEVRYFRVSGPPHPGDDGVSSGVGLGPLAGYKYISDGGFTVFVHVGAEYVAVGSGAATGGLGFFLAGPRGDFHPRLNLNLGWSF